jgi:type IV secretory pathway VirB10-like protein
MSGEVIRPRGSSLVARGRTYLPGRLRAATALGCCGLVVGGLVWMMWPRPSLEPEPSVTTGTSWGMGQVLPDHPTRIVSPPPAAAVAGVPPSRIEPVVAPVIAPAGLRAMGFWEDANAAQLSVQRAASQTTATTPPAGSASGGSDPDVATPGPGSEYAQRMQTTRFADAAPVPHRFHVHYTIKKGTIFPCTPAQPISSSLPGPVRCTADQDVWSMDGTTILLPRGTQVNGTVERGLTGGEDRLFLVWTDALTPRPDLLAIPLDSPAADEMGQTGVPGDVNDHLWKRIKTALLLSAVEFAANAGTAALQQGRSNTYLNFNGVGNTANSLAQMAFGRDMNIPPTLYRGPGQPLTIYVNHYIDLFRFYQNRVR